MAALTHGPCVVVGVVLVLLTTCVMAQPTVQGNGLFIVGQTKTMACYITSAETVSSFPLAWSTGGSTLIASQEQTINVAGNVKNYNSFYRLTVSASDNLDIYTCTATLPSGTTSATWTVYVYKGPDTPIISGPTAVVSGVTNTWTCIVDGASSTAPNVYWQFGNGTRLDTGTFSNVAQVYTDSNNLEIHKETSTLTLTVTTGAPSFTLSCRAVHFETSTQSAAEIAVIVTYPPVVSGGGVNYTVTAGSTATLACQITASPSVTSVFWYKDGALVDSTSGRISGGTVASPSLVISGLVKADAGYYVCGGTNGIGSANGSSNYLGVRYRPVITYPSNPVGGVIGADVTLPCVIDAVPAYTTVFWYRVDGTTGTLTAISSASNPSKYSGGTTSTPSLTIKSLTTSDAGLYRCKADNNVGRGEGGNLEVQVNYKPRITVQPTVTGTEPQSMTIACDVDALPALTSLTWYKGGQLLDISSTSRYSGGTTITPNLTIVSVGPDDAGTYYCVASNSIGSTTSGTTTLTVRYFPVFTISQTQVGGQVGETVTLTVSLAANPALSTLQWRKHVSNNVYSDINVTTSRYSGGIISNPSLQINSLIIEDVGDYVVVATNDLGSRQSVDITVAVSYVPTTPSITGLTSYNESEQILLACSSSGFPQPAYRWYRGSSSIASNATLTIANAAPIDNSQFTCEAYNTLGSARSSVSVNVQYRPRAGSSLFNVTASIGQDVTLTCFTDANPAPTSYTWYHLGRVVSSASSSSQWTVSVSNSSMLGSYSCVATNNQGASDPIIVYVIQDTSGGGGTGGGSVGASTEDTGLSTATLALIIIICLIILIVIVLVTIYCCTTRKCFKKDNDVGPTQATQPPPTMKQRMVKEPEPYLNGFVKPMPPLSTAHAKSNGRIDLDEEKVVPAAPAPAPVPAFSGTTSLGPGFSISVPGGSTPRPHHLPPLGQDGVPEEIEPALEDKPKEKKKKRRRRHDGENGSPSRHRSRRHDPEV